MPLTSGRDSATDRVIGSGRAGLRGQFRTSPGLSANTDLEGFYFRGESGNIGTK